MNAIQEAFSRFFMLINGDISFPFQASSNATSEADEERRRLQDEVEHLRKVFMIGFEFRRAEEKWGGGGGEQWMEEKQSGQKIKYLSAVKQMPSHPRPLKQNLILFSSYSILFS